MKEFQIQFCNRRKQLNSFDLSHSNQTKERAVIYYFIWIKSSVIQTNSTTNKSKRVLHVTQHMLLLTRVLANIETKSQAQTPTDSAFYV